MTFDQSSWQLSNSRVYNIAGDLRLTEGGGPAEFAAVVAELRSRVQALEGVSESERAAVDAELAQVVGLSESVGEADAGPPGDDEIDDGDDSRRGIVRRLGRARDLLRGVTGTVTAATELGDSLDTLAHWAGQQF
ncbi:hypothetical protein [Streptomyces sp. NPDC057257]|uniref:hypothetical protein n=1 Tax=Streptomyces sp. NPDC057257 TaxID=3346071 RepID=UPI00362B4E48